jgi:hypothetical protein
LTDEKNVNSWRRRVPRAVLAATAVLFIGLAPQGESLAALPAPGDLPSSIGDHSLRVEPSVARAGQVVRVDVTGNWSFVYSIDQLVGDQWIKRWEGMGCGVSEPERAEPARFWQLACPLSGQPEDRGVRLPRMADGTYRLRSLFYTDPLGRAQFELAAEFTVH